MYGLTSTDKYTNLKNPPPTKTQNISILLEGFQGPFLVSPPHQKQPLLFSITVG